MVELYGLWKVHETLKIVVVSQNCLGIREETHEKI
jgi:hypothetical protein